MTEGIDKSLPNKKDRGLGKLNVSKDYKRTKKVVLNFLLLGSARLKGGNQQGIKKEDRKPSVHG